MNIVELDTNKNNRISIDGKDYFTIMRNGKVDIIPTRCPHRGGPLHYGNITQDGEFMVCPWHDNKFKIAKLSCKNFSILRRLNKLILMTEGEKINIWYEDGLTNSIGS